MVAPTQIIYEAWPVPRGPLCINAPVSEISSENYHRKPVISSNSELTCIIKWCLWPQLHRQYICIDIQFID